MGHVALRVADVDAYVAYVVQALGLRVVERRGDTAYLASTASRHELQVSPGVPGFDHVGLMADSEEDLERAIQRAVAAGGAVVDPDREPEPGIGPAAMVLGPGGLRHELYVPTARPTTDPAFSLGEGIRRLGHLTFLSEHAEAIVAFWTEGLGFRVSDVVGPGFTWTRCDAYHHTLAVGTHPETVLHHHAWEVQDVAALAKHCDRNGLDGRAQIWGPVRHGPGFNLATYMPDTTGALIEVYADLLMIADEDGYRPVDWSERPDAMNLWGPPFSPEMLTAGLTV